MVVFGEVVEGSHDLCEVSDEPLVEVAEPDEFSDPPYLGGRLPLTDCVAFVLIHLEPISGEFYSQEVDPVFVEFTFFWVEEDFGLPTQLEEMADCRNVGIEGRGVDVGVVEVPQDVFHEFWFIVEVIVDKLLEVWGCVHEAEGEDVGLVGSVWCVECGQPFLALLDADLVIPGFHVEF